MRKIFVMILMLGVGIAMLTPYSRASQASRMALVTFQERVEIPGMVLAPGEYLIEMITPENGPPIVTFWNPEKTRVFASVPAKVANRDTPADTAIVTFTDGPQNVAALKTLFYPGERVGARFIYRGEQVGTPLVYRMTVVGKVIREPRPRLSSVWEPVILQVDWNNRQEFDLNYAFLMFILGWDQILEHTED